MQVGLAAADRAWLRDWSTHYVRGGGVLPTLLVGSQPYGLLPVSLVETPAGPRPGGSSISRQMLGFLRPTWDEVVRQQLPRLDPEAGDAPPGAGERAALVSQVLGGVPHPTAFSPAAGRRRARHLHDARGTASLYLDPARRRRRPVLGRQHGQDRHLARSDWRDKTHDKEFDTVMWTSWLGLQEHAARRPPTPDDQLAALEFYRGELERLRDSPTYASQRTSTTSGRPTRARSMIAFVAGARRPHRADRVAERPRARHHAA